MLFLFANSLKIKVLVRKNKVGFDTTRFYLEEKIWQAKKILKILLIC